MKMSQLRPELSAVDYSPVERGAAAQGQAMQNVGQSIGGAIQAVGEHYKGKKAKAKTAKAQKSLIQGLADLDMNDPNNANFASANRAANAVIAMGESQEADGTDIYESGIASKLLGLGMGMGQEAEESPKYDVEDAKENIKINYNVKFGKNGVTMGGKPIDPAWVSTLPIRDQRVIQAHMGGDSTPTGWEVFMSQVGSIRDSFLPKE